MAHLIPDSEVERLSSLAGVSWKNAQHPHGEFNIKLHDLIEESWQHCFPIWRKYGRVNDLSYKIRVPSYCPSFANIIGHQFVETHYKDYAYLINLLETMPINSYEYLCAYDLLEMIADEFYSRDEDIPTAILAINLPIPHVVHQEKGWDKRFDGLASIGKFIHKSCLISFGDEA